MATATDRPNIVLIVSDDHGRETVGCYGNPVVRTVADSDLVLDVSGGDSFTDLYGAARFRQIIAPKQIALATGRPLVLLPQTYGPFSRATSRAKCGSGSSAMPPPLA